jgi:hypothetical protein
MSLSSKSTSLQSYSMALYRSALHPEFFKIEGRQCIAHGDYEFEAWIFRGGHTLRFEHQGLCVTEVISEDVASLPDRGHVTTLPCAGERDHEAEFAERIVYMASMQTETLNDHLYRGTYNELLEHGRFGDCLMSVWHDDEGKRNLSVIDLQRYGGEVHAQAYHLRSDCGLVLRSQSIFQIKGA